MGLLAKTAGIKTLVNSFKKTGKIGAATPETMANARKEALAAAFGKPVKDKKGV